MKNYTIEKMTEKRAFYNFTEPNKKGEKITIEITECEAGKEQKKIGFPAHWLSIQTYVTKEDGSCYGGYNPFIEPYEYGRRIIVDKLLTPSENNIKKALEMVAEMAF